MMKGLFAIHKSLLFILCFVTLLLLVSCKKKTAAAEGQTVTEGETEENTVKENPEVFYNPAEDDASWVDSLLMKLEEERIAQELAKMEESRSEYQQEEADDFEGLEKDVNADAESGDGTESDSESESDSGTEPGENSEVEEKSPVELFFEEQIQGQILRGKNNQLRFYEFQNEILAPQKTDDGYVMIHSADGNVMRNFYNPEYQLVKKEEWTIKSADSAKKLKTEQYKYSEESGKINQKEIFTETSYEKVSYNAAAYPALTKKYALKDDKQYIVMERKWKYDEENRVLADEETEYFYKDSDYKNKASPFTRKYEYQYNDNWNTDKKEKDKIPPDLKYYEKGLLKMQNKYTAEKGNYVSYVYFDENLSVKTYYEEELRVREEFYNKGKLIRTKLYEKTEGGDKAADTEGEKQ